MPTYQLAQVNIGRVKAPMEDPLMAGFVARLDEINALADRSPGFVWRLQTPVGNATYFRPYPEDDRILINMSVWESIAALRHYVYKTAHAELLRQSVGHRAQQEAAMICRKFRANAGHVRISDLRVAP